MFGNGFPDQNDMDYNQDEFTEEFEHKPYIMHLSIPKIEPSSTANESNEKLLNVDEVMTSPIPFVIPYKIKDPIILLERCDKIWETLKVIKNVQNKSKTNMHNAVPLEVTTSKSLYVEYQPVLGNNNAGLPNFKFSVKTKKKLFHCVTCGKQYTENRTLRFHSEKVHGIYIPPMRSRYSTLYQKAADKVKKKDANIIEKDTDNSENFLLKKGENKLHVEATLQLQSLSNNNVVERNSHSQRRKNNLIHNSSNVDVNESMETMKDEQNKKVLNKELKQNEKLISLLMCTLCKKVVKDMKEHLIDYHKIESLDFMLKNANETFTDSGDKLKKMALNNENETLSEITEEEHLLSSQNKKKQRSSTNCVNPKKRHKVDTSNNSQIEENSTRQCDICFGYYRKSSFPKHVRAHRKRGETKENFHLSSNKYINSPLYLKSKTNSNNMSYENSNNYTHGELYNLNSSNNKETGKEIIQSKEKNKRSNTKHYKNICSCGRSFRNPYTLFIHKKTCTLPDKIKQPTTESNVNKTNRYVTRNNFHGNSGAGINITIKKKNNSYEIIDKGNENANRIQDFNYSKEVNATSGVSENCTQIQLQDSSHGTPELSKYSEKHSILKIQSVDEDIDIDIEDDSQPNLSNNNNSNFMSEKINDTCKENEQQEIKQEQDDESYQENVNLEFPQKSILATRKHKLSNGIKVNFAIKYNVCVCGHKFYTKTALEIHVNKHHSSSEPSCGYCKVSFPDVIAWNKHQCSINQGKKFIDLPVEINCRYCTVTLNTCKRFDEHIKRKHYDAVLPFQCIHCHKRFSNTTFRQIHFNEEHGLTFCSICNNKYDNVMQSRHKAYHYGLGFPCHICKKTYSSKHNLMYHKRRVHSKVLHTAKYNLDVSSFMCPNL